MLYRHANYYRHFSGNDGLSFDSNSVQVTQLIRILKIGVTSL